MGINKAGWLDQGAEKNGVPTKIYWDIVINPQGKSLKNVKVTDTIGDGQTYDNGSATFHSVEYHEGQESTRTGTVSGTTSVSGNTITFNLGDIDTPVEIEYETTITNINVNGGNLGVTKQRLRLQHQMLNGHVQLIQQPLTGELVGQFKVTPVRSKLQRLTQLIKPRSYQGQSSN